MPFQSLFMKPALVSVLNRLYDIQRLVEPEAVVVSKEGAFRANGSDNNYFVLSCSLPQRDGSFS